MMEYRDLKLGMLDEHHDARDYNLSVVGVMPDSNYPKEVKPLIKHPIRHQGITSMCFAFALAKVIETQHYLETGESIKVSEGFIYWTKSFKDIEGMIPSFDLNNQRKIGTVLEEDFRSFGNWEAVDLVMGVHDVSKLLKKANKYRSKSTLRLNSVEIVPYLHLWRGGIISVEITESFYTTGSDGKVPKMDGKSYGGHAMYVDEIKEIDGISYACGDNSWGIAWGDSGRFAIALDNPCIKCFYGLVDVNPITNEITLEIGSKTMVTSKGNVELDVAPFITPEGRTVIPLRAISEMFGKNVVWKPLIPPKINHTGSKIVIQMKKNVADMLII